MADVVTAAAGFTEIIRQILSAKDRAEAASAVSLTQYNKPANIISKVYVQDSVSYDDICLPLLGTLNQLYASYIMTALNMQSVVVGGRTVRELYGVIATESFGTATILTDDFGQEHLDDTITSMSIREASMEGGLIDLDKDSQRLVCGRLLEIDLTLECARNTDKVSVNTYKIYVYVQLVPFILTQDICKGFLTINFHPPMSVRWKQVQAGEISFWKDFMFSQDLLHKEAKLLRDDKSGALANILMNQQNKLGQWFLRLVGAKPCSSNLANSMIIMDKPTFQAACREVGADFASKSYRQTFFMRTMSIFVVVVDIMGGSIDMYFNGIDVKGTYTFQMINKIGAKGKDNFNLAEIMQTFSQNMSPRF